MLATLTQTHEPLLLHVLPLPEQAPLQQRPPRFTPEEHSTAAEHVAPPAFFAAHEVPAQYWVAGSQQSLPHVG